MESVFGGVEKTEKKRFDALRKIYEGQGKFVLSNRNFNAGVDMLIIDSKTGRIEKVIECTNYQRRGYWIGKEKR